MDPDEERIILLLADAYGKTFDDRTLEFDEFVGFMKAAKGLGDNIRGADEANLDSLPETGSVNLHQLMALYNGSKSTTNRPRITSSQALDCFRALRTLDMPFLADRLFAGLDSTGSGKVAASDARLTLPIDGHPLTPDAFLRACAGDTITHRLFFQQLTGREPDPPKPTRCCLLM